MTTSENLGAVPDDLASVDGIRDRLSLVENALEVGGEPGEVERLQGAAAQLRERLAVLSVAAKQRAQHHRKLAEAEVRQDELEDVDGDGGLVDTESF